ncbi:MULTISPECIES: FMN-binding glutamate synthase family protein [Comamonas]|jgi:glutamate synthase domain-containing protein 2|uniref:FMN-binding glutamate synthase family protein n=1 Tax=Comamonas TaxID=283 RepID=UPI00283F5D41|nr:MULTISPECIES: FMN-binding glutamate synthase family protein [Comamonas]MDR3067047.1 FMN-binding glutamate synthase family protein [Comamonas sp.]MEB5963174.1 FMN-binding glutamate synthase family protein [Comamonas testosteroni]
MGVSAVHRFFNSLPLRYGALFVSALALGISLYTLATAGKGLGWLMASTLLVLLGIWDLRQKQHAILRNYPIMGHLRFIFEFIRPEIRQYFIEGDTEAQPFSRAQRSLVYQRAKGQVDNRPFGTQLDVSQQGYEWVNHSLQPTKLSSHDFRLWIGGTPEQPNEGLGPCTRPYHASVFNISAMSFGALSGNAVQALNQGAKMGGFIHDTGEGSISQYHRMHGGDLIWEVASGYFGCRNADGTFSEEKFIANATDPQVKMIEIKLSQGAKPGHGGMLPGAKVTPEIAAARGIPIGVDCISPSSHSAFSTPVELMQFIARLRRLSGGKPTGFKFCVGHPWEWFAMVKAMLETDITPDFIVVDGAEGGTGAAPVEFVDHVGVPLQEGLLLVHNTLLGVNLRQRIKIGAAGKVITAFDIARMMALGADWCNSGRGFMMALGCIQAQSCHTGTCPTGVTTQDAVRQQALVVPDKATRVANFHKNTLHALQELVQAAGLRHPNEITAHHIVRRLDDTQVSLLSNLILRVEPGCLLKSLKDQHKVFQNYWPLATAQSFQPLREPVLRPSAAGSADNAAQSQAFPQRTGIWT